MATAASLRSAQNQEAGKQSDPIWHKAGAGKQSDRLILVQVAEAAAAGKGVVATAAAQRIAQAKQAEVQELGVQLDEAEEHLAQAEAAGRAQAAELAAAVERGEQLQARLQVTKPLCQT